MEISLKQHTNNMPFNLIMNKQKQINQNRPLLTPKTFLLF